MFSHDSHMACEISTVRTLALNTFTLYKILKVLCGNGEYTTQTKYPIHKTYLDNRNTF